MKKIILLFAMVAGIAASAQTRFINSGRIQFERKLNQHKPFEESDNSEWYKDLIKTLPKMVTDVYELRFNEHRSVFKLEKENTDNKYTWGSKPSENDITVQDISNQRVIMQKEVFENTYLINDSLRQLEWRISNETRDIAGFECKKAVTKICDSVVVVAFYTDQIPVSAGPEGFGGLPGMILGLAVPRLYTTWFATKLELTEPTAQQLNPVQKGKKVNWNQLYVELKKGLKDWGKEGHRNIWRVSL